MKQIDGQMNFAEYISSRDERFTGCRTCVCESCLYKQSSRCQHGQCYDDYRAKKDPYDKTYPEKSPRTAWSDWDEPGEQAHWCRGGIFYPVHYCENFVKYQDCTIEECVNCNIVVFQDGYISCSLKDIMGFDACVDQKSARERIKQYGCQHMTETGCEAHINALSLMAKAILEEGEDMEMCGEQCCIGCKKNCGFRCGKV